MVSFKNGFKHLHPVYILLQCKHNLYFFWNRFEHIGDGQYLEIGTTSKEIMSFYDHGVVVARFVNSHNKLSAVAAFPYLLVKEGF